MEIDTTGSRKILWVGAPHIRDIAKGCICNYFVFATRGWVASHRRRAGGEQQEGAGRWGARRGQRATNHFGVPKSLRNDSGPPKGGCFGLE